MKYSLLFLTPCILILGSCTQRPENSKIGVAENTTPTVTTTGVSKGGLLDTSTLNILQNAYREELLAHDIYTEMVRQYPSLTEVTNIISSEEQHREKVGNLLDIYGIPRPTEYGIYKEPRTELLALVSQGLTGAIEAGVRIEVGDIEHLLTEYGEVNNPDIRRVFENIGGGSFNHLRAFLRESQKNNYTPSIDTTPYLTSIEVRSSGPLNYKMTDMLIARGFPVSETGGSQKGGGGRNMGHSR